MKSSKLDLRKRGMASEEDITLLQSLSTEELCKKVNSSVPAERSAAVIVLRSRCTVHDPAHVARLLERLAIEKALYTKLEITVSLEAGNEITASLMCDYLGRIGNNQHRIIPETVSKKKSFPLPRDIIARSLGRMNTCVFPVLLNRLKTNERQELTELTDAIGYMAFYNKELATEEAFLPILQTYEKYISDELIVWKISLCCSGFPLKESVDLLDRIKSTGMHPTIRKEADRSLALIFPVS
jgi:hypothetical protein